MRLPRPASVGGPGGTFRRSALWNGSASQSNASLSAGDNACHLRRIAYDGLRLVPEAESPPIRGPPAFYGGVVSRLAFIAFIARRHEADIVADPQVIAIESPTASCSVRTHLAHLSACAAIRSLRDRPPLVQPCWSVCRAPARSACQNSTLSGVATRGRVLVGHRGRTRRAYFNDIRAWYGWCAEVGIHPLEAQRHHVDHWIAELSELPQPKTGKPAAASTIIRRLSCVPGSTSTPSSTPGCSTPRPSSGSSGRRSLTTRRRSVSTKQELVKLLEAADVDGLRFRPRSSRCSPSTVYASTRRCPETSNI